MPDDELPDILKALNLRPKPKPKPEDEYTFAERIRDLNRKNQDKK